MTPTPSVTGKRYFIAVGVADPGADARLPKLESVPGDLARMRELFVTRLGYEDVTLSPGERADHPRNLDLDAQQVSTGLLTWVTRLSKQPADSVVLYFTGHAFERDGTFWLCTRGFRHDQMATGLDVRTLMTNLRGGAHKIWIVLDVCRAGEAGAEIAYEASKGDNGATTSFWFLASTGGRASSSEAVFSQAFVEAAQNGPRGHDLFVDELQRCLSRLRATQTVRQVSAGSSGFDLLLPVTNVPVSPAEVRVASTSHRLRWGIAAALAVLLAVLIGWSTRAVSGLTAEPGTVANPPPPPPMQPPAAASAPSTPPVPAAAMLEPVLALTASAKLEVQVLVERQGALVEVDEQRPLRSGESFGMYVTLGEPAYLGVLHVSAKGEVTRLYPVTAELRVEPGEQTRIPRSSEGDFGVDDEQGAERFVVFASVRPLKSVSPRRLAEQLRSEVAWPRSWLLATAAEPQERTRGVRVRGSFFRAREQRPDTVTVVAAVLLEVGHVAAD